MKYKCYGEIVEREMTFKSFIRNYPEGTYITIGKESCLLSERWSSGWRQCTGCSSVKKENTLCVQSKLRNL
jgi:hypothetical protein